MKKYKIILFLILLPLVVQSAAIIDWNQELLDAAEVGDIKLVNNALKYGANVDARNTYQETPLHYAARHGHIEIVNALILAKATIDAKNMIQCTPLHKASRYCHTEVVNALIKAKATIDARDNYQDTPLHLAAYYGDTEIVKALILAKANVDARNTNQETPLNWAARCGCTEVVNVLILAKATIDARNNNQETPLHWATNGRTEVVKLLLEVGSNSMLLNKDNKSILDLITEGWFSQNTQDQLITIIKDHQAYQASMLTELPKLFADQQNQLKIPTPIANIITQYAFGICETEKNNKGDNHDKL